MSDIATNTVSDVLQQVFNQFKSADLFYGHGTDNAWDEAVLLVLHSVGAPMDSSEEVLAQPVSAAQRKKINAQVLRRIEQRIPLPYLTGVAWFAGMAFKADRRAIIPRSPIAELIENDFRPWYRGEGFGRILDLCCGGGCIGIACANSCPDSQVDLIDLDRDALSLAAENISRFGLDERVAVIHSDLFAGVEGQRYDLIVSNPPYVDASDLSSMPAEYAHEPGFALGSGEDGLDITRNILRRAGHYLNAGGLLIVEVGNSGEALEQVFPEVPFTWVEFSCGGHGVFTFTAEELRSYQQSF